MLSQLIRNSRRLPLFLPFRLATLSNQKIVADKKRIYQAQTLADPLKTQNNNAKRSQEEEREREN